VAALRVCMTGVSEVPARAVTVSSQPARPSGETAGVGTVMLLRTQPRQATESQWDSSIARTPGVPGRDSPRFEQRSSYA
jgi:hypothetical protein